MRNDEDSQMSDGGDTAASSPMLSRRAALGGAAALASLAGALSAEKVGAAESKRTPDSKGSIVASRESSVVTTATGRVRGYARNGVHTFKGIPYAESTAGANRFM